ncbi:MAG: GNAT family N-acetyltransferase [Saprospiraceae bacterium]|nr:GNAT family N-acetyltransferase [Saprospiraceae bacterium]
MTHRIRRQLRAEDLDSIKEIVVSTNFFNEEEVAIALELVEENLLKGEKLSGYIFNIYEIDAIPVAFICFGKISGTTNSFDLYWIVVHEAYKRKGIGLVLMNEVKVYVAQQGGGQIWIETSSRPLYAPTHQFYLQCGCKKMSKLPHYYAQGDHKITYRLIV